MSSSLPNAQCVLMLPLLSVSSAALPLPAPLPLLVRDALAVWSLRRSSADGWSGDERSTQSSTRRAVP